MTFRNSSNQNYHTQIRTEIRRQIRYCPQGPLDPVAAQVAQAFAATPLSAYPVAQTRAAMQEACHPAREPAMDLVKDYQIPVDGTEISLRVYRPPSQPAAILIWAHGGGFALGSLEESDNFCRLMAAQTNCTVVSVAYRLAPEYQFPAPVHDVEEATLWVFQNRAGLAGNGAPVWLGGDSAGGNLATVVTRRLHEGDRLPEAEAIAGNILAYPCTDTPDDPLLLDFEPPFMTAKDVAWFIDMYLPDPALRLHPDFAPIRASTLDKLPPTLIITAEHDILTPQAEAYARRLVSSDVRVEVIRAAGMIHGFLTMDPFLPGEAGNIIGNISQFIARQNGTLRSAPV